MNRYEWNYIDDLKVFYLYRKIKEDIDLKQIKPSSIGYKLSNYAYLDTRKGKENASIQSKEIYKNFKSKSLKEIKAWILDYEDERAECINEFKQKTKKF